MKTREELIRELEIVKTELRITRDRLRDSVTENTRLSKACEKYHEHGVKLFDTLRERTLFITEQTKTIQALQEENESLEKKLIRSEINSKRGYEMLNKERGTVEFKNRIIESLEEKLETAKAKGEVVVSVQDIIKELLDFVDNKGGTSMNYLERLLIDKDSRLEQLEKENKQLENSLNDEIENVEELEETIVELEELLVEKDELIDKLSEDLSRANFGNLELRRQLKKYRVDAIENVEELEETIVELEELLVEKDELIDGLNRHIESQRRLEKYRIDELFGV